MLDNEVREHGDYYEWLANMQHYGCSTRFLDVTFSFFTAMYFAIRHIDFASADEQDCTKSFAIWCFNRMWIEKEYKQYLSDEIQEKYKKYDPFGKAVCIQKAVLNHVPMVKKSGRRLQKRMFSRHQHDSLLFEQTFNPSKRLVFNADQSLRAI